MSCGKIKISVKPNVELFKDLLGGQWFVLAGYENSALYCKMPKMDMKDGLPRTALEIENCQNGQIGSVSFVIVRDNDKCIKVFPNITVGE